MNRARKVGSVYLGGGFRARDRSWGGCREVLAADRKMVKIGRAHGGCLGAVGRRRTWLAAKSLGEPQAGVEPGISEWGNLARVESRHP